MKQTHPAVILVVGVVLGAAGLAGIQALQNKQEPIHVCKRTESSKMMGHTMPGGMDMSMTQMTTELQGKVGDEFDQAFLTMMIDHHQGAIDMSEAATVSAKHPELKNLATEIIVAQTKEIQAMKAWQSEWGYSK